MSDTTAPASLPEKAAPVAKPLWQKILKWVLFAVVLVYVSRHLWQMWRDGQAHTITVHWGYVVIAIGLFTLSWTPSIFVWRKLLRSCHQEADLTVIAKAFYIGHFGKYVPGKAMALAIRGWLARDEAGVPMRIGVLTAGYEAIAFMAAGSFWAMIFLPVGMKRLLNEWQIPDWFWWLWPLLIVTLLLISLPVVAQLMNQLSRKMASQITDTPPLTIGPWQLLALLAQLSIAWFIKAIALACLWVGVSSAGADLPNMPTCLAAATIANVGGFLVFFAPAGLGPREWLMIEVFSQPGSLSSSQIAVITILARLVSFLGEAVGAVIFALVSPRRAVVPEVHDSTPAP